MIRKNANTKNSDITLGTKYRDKVHGIEGVAVSKHVYLTGCDRVVLEWVKDGEIKDASFDATQLIEVAQEKPVRAARIPGGPARTPAAKSLGR